MRGRTKLYREYLDTFQWAQKREAALERAKHECQRCGAVKDLEVHHLHYNNLFDERPEDLQVLCISCHKQADHDRRVASHFKAGLNTFATKKYGECWQDFCDPDQIAEEFQAWRERRADQ